MGEILDGDIWLRRGVRRDSAMKAIRVYAGKRPGNPWLLAGSTTHGFVLAHAGQRAKRVKFTFSLGRKVGQLTFRVSGDTASLALSYLVTALVNTDLRAKIDSIEVFVPEP